MDKKTKLWVIIGIIAVFIVAVVLIYLYISGQFSSSASDNNDPNGYFKIYVDKDPPKANISVGVGRSNNEIFALSGITNDEGWAIIPVPYEPGILYYAGGMFCDRPTVVGPFAVPHNGETSTVHVPYICPSHGALTVKIENITDIDLARAQATGTIGGNAVTYDGAVSGSGVKWNYLLPGEYDIRIQLNNANNPCKKSDFTGHVAMGDSDVTVTLPCPGTGTPTPTPIPTRTSTPGPTSTPTPPESGFATSYAKDQNGSSLSGASVSGVRQDNSGGGSTQPVIPLGTTDSSGILRSTLVTGTWVISASKSGYNNATPVRTTIVKNQTSSIYLTLRANLSPTPTPTVTPIATGIANVYVYQKILGVWLPFPNATTKVYWKNANGTWSSAAGKTNYRGLKQFANLPGGQVVFFQACNPSDCANTWTNPISKTVIPNGVIRANLQVQK